MFRFFSLPDWHVCACAYLSSTIHMESSIFIQYVVFSIVYIFADGVYMLFCNSVSFSILYLIRLAFGITKLLLFTLCILVRFSLILPLSDAYTCPYLEREQMMTAFQEW